MIAESPPPDKEMQSSRHFYRTDRIRKDDRLFVNTIRALYPAAADIAEEELEQNKVSWLQKFQSDGRYMVEALDTSLAHEITKQQRQELIREHIADVIKKVRGLATQGTKIILIKSNVYEVAAVPLREAGFSVANTELVDYPGRFNQRAYRDKLRRLLS
jgi:hypothetical protein